MEPFVYQHMGSLAYVGDHKAVGQILGKNALGFGMCVMHLLSHAYAHSSTRSAHLSHLTSHAHLRPYTCTHAHTHTYHRTRICAHTHSHACTHCVCARTHTHMHTCTYAHMHTRIHCVPLTHAAMQGHGGCGAAFTSRGKFPFAIRPSSPLIGSR